MLVNGMWKMFMKNTGVKSGLSATAQLFPQSKWKRETGTAEEKLPLQVSIASDGGDDDDVDMPTAMAPSPAPWERRNQLSKPTKPDDSHSFKSIDSDGNRPPSYNYVMKKGAPANGGAVPLRADMAGEEGYKETSC